MKAEQLTPSLDCLTKYLAEVDIAAVSESGSLGCLK